MVLDSNGGRGRFRTVAEELKTIMFVDLACESKAFMEKLFWLALGTFGGIWLVYFMVLTIEDDNPKTIMKSNLKINDVKYPGITICSEYSTKYAIAQRLGNYYNSHLNLSDELTKIKDEILKKRVPKFQDDTYWEENDYETGCIIPSSKQLGCLVIFASFSRVLFR